MPGRMMGESGENAARGALLTSRVVGVEQVIDRDEDDVLKLTLEEGAIVEVRADRLRLSVWIEMQPVHDNVVFADQDEEDFDRAGAWRAALAGSNRAALEDVRVELGEKDVEGVGTIPVVRWWQR